MASFTLAFPVTDICGKIGNEEVGFAHRKASGHKYVVKYGKRNYELHPLTARELAARAAFKSAVQAANSILMNDEQKSQALQRFANAKDKKLTTATTLKGFLVQENY